MIRPALIEHHLHGVGNAPAWHGYTACDVIRRTMLAVQAELPHVLAVIGANDHDQVLHYAFGL